MSICKDQQEKLILSSFTSSTVFPGGQIRSSNRVREYKNSAHLFYGWAFDFNSEIIRNFSASITMFQNNIRNISKQIDIVLYFYGIIPNLNLILHKKYIIFQWNQKNRSAI